MYSKSMWDLRKPSFGFVSTRFSGTDGVTLETKKWEAVMRDKGCDCYYMAGLLDTDPAISKLVERAFFQHEDIVEIQHELFRNKKRSRALSSRIHELAEELKTGLYEFHNEFNFDILVPENALAIPVNIPLGIAITEFISETGIPTIAHHHDFYWERQRFNSAAAMDYLRKAFPPVSPHIQHVVINSCAGEALGRRTGEKWTLIPNILDFKDVPMGIDEYTADFRKEIGLKEDDIFILQPTRIVSRKGIESAIELVKRMNHPNSVLVISHEAGDEGFEYQKRVIDYADFLGVDMRIVSNRISEERGTNKDGEKTYTLWDIYPHCDLVTYPSTYEGYGNAFVEAIYFKKPVVVNRYSIFEADIEPKGFDVIAFSGFITDGTVEQVRNVLADKARRDEMAETNYMLGWRYLSYEMLEEKLEGCLREIYGT